ncbi:hypothetical protein [Winogradskyella sp. MIT101101]|uniref:hypothetical protein n=1 Tax=Winogradskyella sp. MIT101101 TaxID=3098297 RepID=UPI00399C3975
MGKIAVRQTRSKISKKLKEFGRVLLESQIITSANKINEAANNCLDFVPEIKGIKYDRKNSWGYEVSDLQIRFSSSDIEADIFPVESTISSITVSSKVIGRICRDDYAEDPLYHIEFNLVVKGLTKKGEPLVASWHLDRHPDDSPTEAVHPVYHFQYGGRKLTIPNDNYGNHLVLDMPRIMHPPLDLILGVDFVLSNFLGSTRISLCAERPYVNSVAELQYLIWRPYVCSLARYWPTYGTDSSRYEWKSDSIYPQLLKSI